MRTRNKFDHLLNEPEPEPESRAVVEGIIFETWKAPDIDELRRIRDLNRLKRQAAQDAEDLRNSHPPGSGWIN